MPVIIELHKAVWIISSRIDYHFTALAGSYLCEDLQNEGLCYIPGQIPHIQGPGLIVLHHQGLSGRVLRGSLIQKHKNGLC